MKVKIIKKGKAGVAFGPEKAKEILREKHPTLHKHPITAKQRRWLGWQAGGAKADNGASLTPLADNVVQFNGDSHEEGGIPMSYGKNKVEVEGGETAYKSPIDNSLHVMGNMINPLTNRKFKEDSKRLAEKERKIDKLIDRSTELVNKNDPTDKWQNLSFNSGKVMLEGGLRKKKEIADNKEWLATLQKTMLEHAGELGADPQEFSKGRLKKAQFGAFYPTGKPSTKKDRINPGIIDYMYGRKKPAYMEEPQSVISNPSNIKPISPTQIGTPSTQAQPTTLPGNWDFRGTKTQGLDQKILDFLPLLQQHGLTGYSGPESGVSQRNTKSGRLSRHAQSQALDAFINQPDAYNTVLKNPALTKYLIDNGLTIINEYDPSVASKTGATAGHLHIGYDRGTGISDQFRKDAAKIYKAANPDWGWGRTVRPGGKAIENAPTGDQQFFPVKISKDFPTFDPNSIKYPTTDEQRPKATPSTYDLTINEPKEYWKPSNAKGLSYEQILPELYTAAINKPEPVWLQQYRPQLYQPYKVSFQDRLNENTATFNALSQTQAHNPAVQSVLAAQKYQADTGVLGEEFRTNQAIEADIMNKNISLLNDAQLKNLGLADTQYVRQAQTKSKVREQNQVILDSISSKLKQNQLEQRTLQIYENLYPNFYFDEKNNMKARYAGPTGDEWINWGGDGNEGTGAGANTAVVKKYDENGRLQFTRTNTSSPIKYQLDQAELAKKGFDLFKTKRDLIRTPTMSQRVKYKPKTSLVGLNPPL